jgi:membrane-associated protein
MSSLSGFSRPPVASLGSLGQRDLIERHVERLEARRLLSVHALAAPARSDIAHQVAMEVVRELRVIELLEAPSAFLMPFPLPLVYCTYMLTFLSACIHLDPIGIIKAGGYVGIAIVVFAESGLLFGIFFPGDSLLFAAGLLSAGAFLNPFLLAGTVVLAAILGDSVGYWFGKNVGVNFFSRKDSLIFKQEYVARTQKFYAKYGARAVLLARFVPIVRTLAPILAGVGSMKYLRFLSYNAVGALAWGGGMVALGYFLGAVIPNAAHYVLPLSLVIIVISFLPILINILRGKKAI